MKGQAKLPTGELVPVAALEGLGYHYYKTHPYYSRALPGQDLPSPERSLEKGAAVECRERCWTEFLPTSWALALSTRR